MELVHSDRLFYACIFMEKELLGLALAMAWGVLPVCLRGQDREMDLQEVEVSAPSGKMYSELGRVLTVLDREEIERLPVRTVDELLDQVAGLDVRQRGTGGVQADLHPEFQTKVKAFIKHLRGIIHEYHEIFTGNVIARTRLQGVGVLSREDAISLGATGGTGRASGWANDVRKHHPYALYGEVDFREIVCTEGDSFARYMVRMDEIMESCHIIEQLIDNIPEGEFRVKVRPVLKLPEGVYTASVEGSRGEFGVFLVSRGDKVPYRLHYRSTGLPLVHAMDTVCRGGKIADLIAIGGTLDFVIPDIDR